MSIYGSATGTFENMMRVGMSNYDAIREIIDNQLDADAEHIHNSLYDVLTQEGDYIYQLVFVDDAQGMTKQIMTEAVMINNSKQASNDKIGRFGFGFLAALKKLTEGKGKATILSKTNSDCVNQMIIDFTEIENSDNYSKPVVHEVTLSMNELWIKHRINQYHGTVIILDCHQSVFNEIKRNLHNENFGQTYHDYINEGKKISMTSNGEINYLIAHDVSDKANATHYNEYEISVWKQTIKVIDPFVVEFKDDSGESVYITNFNKNMSYTSLTQKHVVENYTKVGTVKFTCSIRFSLDETQKKYNWKDDGGFLFKRVKKLICELANPEFYAKNNSGDHNRRPIKAGARFVCTFDTSLDGLIGVEINKSRLNKSNINTLLFVTLEYFANKFCRETSNSIYPKPKPNPKIQLDEDVKKYINIATEYLKHLKTIKRSNNLSQEMKEIYKLQCSILNMPQ